MRRSTIGWTALLLLSWVATGMAATAPKVGDAAPNVTLGITRGGETVKVADYPDKVVVVSFWASWCAPCRKELPILEGVQREGKGHIQVVAVNIEKREAFEKAAQLLGDKMSLQLVNDRGEGAQRTYHVQSIPHMVIFGRNGRIAHIHDGYGERELDAIVDEINQALGAGPTAEERS